MKRIAVVLAVCAAGLVAAGSALAAIDTYQGAFSFRGKGGAKSSPLSFKQKFDIKSKTAGNRTGVLTDIKVVVGSAKADVSAAPTCSSSTIANAGDDTSCPKKALVATGGIKASIGPKSPFTAATGQPCNPQLDVWNGGGGKLVFFFRTNNGSHSCLNGALKTGSVGPFTGSIKNGGGNITVDIPIPSRVTHPVASQVASVSSETLNWTSVSKGSKHTISSTGCKGKRTWKYVFSAATPTGQKETVTTKGTSACG